MTGQCLGSTSFPPLGSAGLEDSKHSHLEIWWLQAGLTWLQPPSSQVLPLVAQGSLTLSSWSLRQKLKGSSWSSLGSPGMAWSPAQTSGKGHQTTLVSGRRRGATDAPCWFASLVSRIRMGLDRGRGRRRHDAANSTYGFCMETKIPKYNCSCHLTFS